MAKMDDTELASLLDGKVTDARRFDKSDLSYQREWAIRFYDGETDIPIEEGKSRVVSQDLADALEWIHSQLLRVFVASDTIAIFSPEKPEDEDGAKQATAGVNFTFLRECDGYRVIKDVMHDGLLHGNGVIKVSWNGAPEYKVETMKGLTQQEYDALLIQPDIEVLDVEEVGPDGEPLLEEGNEAGETNAAPY